MKLNKVKEEILHVIKRNLKDKTTKGLNNYSIVLNIIGHSGIGKTDLCRQAAFESGLEFKEVNLSNKQDMGDLIGIPLNLFEAEVNSVVGWIPESMLAHSSIQPTGRYKMNYATGEDMLIGDKPIVLYLDDFNRANPSILQGVMSLFKDGKINNWCLPKGSTIICSSNPEGDEYVVTETDSAFKTRMISIKADFDLDVWIKEYGFNAFEDKVLNFFLLNKETGLFNQNTNIRKWTLLFHYIEDLEFSTNNLGRFMSLMEGFSQEEINIFNNYITDYNENIPSAHVIMTESINTITDKLLNLCQDRNDINYVVYRKIINYLIFNEGDFYDRICAFINAGILKRDNVITMSNELIESKFESAKNLATKISIKYLIS